MFLFVLCFCCFLFVVCCFSLVGHAPATPASLCANSGALPRMHGLEVEVGRGGIASKPRIRGRASELTQIEAGVLQGHALTAF